MEKYNKLYHDVLSFFKSLLTLFISNQQISMSQQPASASNDNMLVLSMAGKGTIRRIAGRAVHQVERQSQRKIKSAVVLQSQKVLKNTTKIST